MMEHDGDPYSQELLGRTPHIEHPWAILTQQVPTAISET
jgi:hypothetical protein